ncbi:MULTISPECIES: hypothetical protein [Protofrankia]|uniref:Uncharacterized protein n=1 Tax=Candidatus Protofrankia datiscae TaxID=2716812 RepID=F8B371_9ACTN|nr:MULTISPECIES: hypothetical protein [Protofrankia]AEH10871.1 hypothetical protein FsymDg_3592 [Candidatus Protofrankia datiscae]
MDERTWIVDAANVIGARPDGWWRDRAGAALRLHEHLSALCQTGFEASTPRAAGGEDLPTEVVLVLEGPARAGVAASGRPGGGDPGNRAARLVVVHAPGPGDDTVVEAAVEAVRRQCGAVVVITADRALRGRVHAVGATTAGPGWLWALLDRTR